MGKFKANISINNEEKQAEFLVVNTKCGSLLGCKTAPELKILHIGPSAQTVNAVKIENEFQKKYPELSSGIGKLKDYQLKLHIDRKVKPVAQPLRRLPFRIREKVDKKLEELEAKDIIDVSGPTPWVSPLVAVPKSNNDVRICIDIRRANEAVQRERHPIPTVDELLQDFNEATVFSKLDFLSAFRTFVRFVLV